MAFQLAVVIVRGLVLVIAALGGCMSIYLGWKLYKDGMLSPVSGEAGTKSWQIKMASAGPGVFFALFGMLLLVRLVERPTNLQFPTALSNPETSTQSAFVNVPGLGELTRIQNPTRPSVPLAPTRRTCFVAMTSLSMLNGNDVTPASLRDDLAVAEHQLRSSASNLRGEELNRVTAAADTIALLSDNVGQWNVPDAH